MFRAAAAKVADDKPYVIFILPKQRRKPGLSIFANVSPVPQQRFRDGARVYNILAVTERDPDGLYLTCFSREEVPQ